MPCFCCNGEPTIRQPPPEMMAAPPGLESLSKAIARAPAARASIPAATPAAPGATIATSVSYCLTPGIEKSPLLAVGRSRPGSALKTRIEKLDDVGEWVNRVGAGG